MKFERYSEYKDSGIDWLGDIPSDWEVKRLKDVGFIYSGLSGKNGNNFNIDDKKLTKPYISFTSIANSHYIKLSINNRVVITKYEKQNKVKYGDLFFLMSSESYEDIGKNSLLLSKPNETYLNSFCKGFRISDNNYINCIFLNYLLSSQKFRYLMVLEGKGFTRINLKIEKINNFSFIVPLSQEQTKIANYLDTQTAKIAKKVALLEQKIQKYQELKQALINETVLRGLDKTTPLKDSGIEWIGNIPQHWDIKRLKNIYIINKTIVGEMSINFKLLSLTQNGVLLRDIDGGIGKFPAEFNTYQIVKENDLIFCLFDMDVTPRTVGLSEDNGMITGAYTILTPKKYLLPNNKYYYYLFLSADIYKKLSLYYTGLRSTIRKEKFLSLNIIFPCHKEQTQIANYLDQKTSKIDAIIKTTQTQITHLTEFRKTLINDAVTGKIKVA